MSRKEAGWVAVACVALIMMTIYLSVKTGQPQERAVSPDVQIPPLVQIASDPDLPKKMQQKGAVPVTVVRLTSQVYRIRDADTGVVCYVFDGYEKGGMDCLPSTELPVEFQTGLVETPR